eukprot:TRINITY_DN7264_c0_g6_i1.p1 TRINITY_DN7264_c0_g6~~TRINITY_DN7264_c0_g6_i1.p1  ORF type:complete len:173 (-),score=40.37 TRINITY_DN7264_c0_g6_i1:130-582(-)
MAERPVATLDVQRRLNKWLRQRLVELEEQQKEETLRQQEQEQRQSLEVSNSKNKLESRFRLEDQLKGLEQKILEHSEEVKGHRSKLQSMSKAWKMEHRSFSADLEELDLRRMAAELQIEELRSDEKRLGRSIAEDENKLREIKLDQQRWN